MEYHARERQQSINIFIAAYNIHFNPLSTLSAILACGVGGSRGRESCRREQNGRTRGSQRCVSPEYLKVRGISEPLDAEAERSNLVSLAYVRSRLNSAPQRPLKSRKVVRDHALTTDKAESKCHSRNMKHAFALRGP
jgi:hypothetical protein